MVNAWDVNEVDNCLLPPCHFNFQCYTELMKPMERYNMFNKYVMENSLDVTGMSTDTAMEHYDFPIRKLSLKYNSRSVDMPLGFPFNISSYGLLLEILCSIVNMIPNELICTMGDSHIYLNQIDGITEQLNRESYKLPKLKISYHLKKIIDIDEFLEKCNINDFKLINYKYHPTIKIPLSN
jgi:thymidylate synthase